MMVRDELAIEKQVDMAAIRPSALLSYLPAIYASDEFLGRFLRIFEDTLKPLQQMADNMAYYFNPLTAPPEVLGWLATWVNLVIDESWSLPMRRNLIHNAADLYSRRGTKRGLIEYLRLYTGTEPEIAEYVDGMALGPQTQLGINTTIAGRELHSFTVTLRLAGLSESELRYKEASIRRIIEAEKPAHTAYRLRLLTDPPPTINTPPRSDLDDTGLKPEHHTNGHSPPNPTGIEQIKTERIELGF